MVNLLLYTQWSIEHSKVVFVISSTELSQLLLNMLCVIMNKLVIIWYKYYSLHLINVSTLPSER